MCSTDFVIDMRLSNTSAVQSFSLRIVSAQAICFSLPVRSGSPLTLFFSAATAFSAARRFSSQDAQT